MLKATRVGFTGTRQGMTPDQELTFRQILTEHCGTYHHGDCKGSDEFSHRIICDMHRLGAPWAIHVHPPEDPRMRAYCKIPDGMMGEIHLPKPYGVRDQDIVDNSDWVIGIPKGFHEEFRGSGTWWTLRKARKAMKRLVIILPDGNVATSF